MKLPQPHRDRCYFHLGYSNKAGIPLGDLSRLEEALDTIQSDYFYNKVLEQLDRCDRAWELSELAGNDGSRFLSKNSYLGDINRTILTESSKDFRIWRDNYLVESDHLAHLLWVASYRREESLRYRFERGGGEHVAVIPGVADTAAVSRVEATIRYGGSFGY